MQRKNRKWVAAATVVYLFVMWSAYRWAIAQRPADGNILDHIQNEEVRKLKQRLAAEAVDVAKTRQPTGQSRLDAAGPAFFAARYDQTHVVFMAVTATESRFSTSSLNRLSGNPTRIAAPAKPAAPLGGLQELWEPDSQSLHFFPKIIQQTQPGDRWVLELSPESTVPVVIDRAVVAPTGCSLGLGFLASVAPDFQNTFALSPREYFVVRHSPVELTNPAAGAHIIELPGWKASPAMSAKIERQLNDRMREELSKIDGGLIANATSPDASAGESPIGSARPRLQEWLHADRGLARGEGVLDYDLRGFRLTPDGAPRLYARARWQLAGAPVFLMSAWFKEESPIVNGASKADALKPDPSGANSRVVLLFADSSWSTLLRAREASDSLGDSLDFQSILNEFDADRDGWAELLIHSDEGSTTSITLYLYTDMGLVRMKTPFRRDAHSPESCVDPDH